jgi:glycosyltransferase
MSEVMVSVVCTNYNKGPWVVDAIESFLRQKTNFAYEVIIIDDKSTDNSPEIIKKYAREHPDKIKAVFNRKNLGITKTWKKVCLQANGKYIARCDGDDYWIDDCKLQKQVDALNKNRKSKWCNTDFDIINENGEMLQEAGFQNGHMKMSDSYEDVFANKGFTMASTWLVDTALMRQINDELDDNAVDDTFNIQLDLFRKTKLTYIPEATTVYRVCDDSDSRPVDPVAIENRNKRLVDTQLAYLKKYRDVDYVKIIKELLVLSEINDNRLALINRQRSLIEAQEEKVKDLNKAIEEIDKQKADILSSITYRAGKIILAPFKAIKDLAVRKDAK